VILLSARAGEESRIEGLGAGADDYVVKPFAARELLARVGALLELTRTRRESEQRFRAFVQATSDAVYRMSADWSELRQLQGRDFIEDTTDPSRTWLDKYIPPEDRPQVLSAIQAAISDRSILELEHRVRRVDGTVGWTFSRAIPVFDAKGALVEWFGAASDVTQRHRMEEALLHRSAQFEALLDHAPLGTYLVDADFRICEANPTARLFFGDLPDLIGSDFEMVMRVLWPPAYAEEIVGQFRRTLEMGEPYRAPERFEQRLDRGVTEYYEWQIHRIPLPDGRYGVVCYARDVSTHVQARSELLRQQRELEAADRQKNEFLAMLAHELRNPLAPIRNSGELLSRQLAEDPQVRTAVSTIDRQVTHLAHLVDDLLDVSRITQGRIELRRSPVQLADIIARAIETVDPLIQQKRHRVAVYSSRKPLVVDVDTERLVQCLANVLTNAAKYTDTEGEIRIESRAEGAEAIVTVSDNGIGIPPDLLPRIFDLFVQSDRSLDRAQGGLGIGLSLVKRLVEMHGGRVTASSGGTGAGSSFEIRLPLAERPLPAPEQVRSNESPKRRVLIVDDNEDAANSLAMVLQFDGHDVKVVYSGAQALECALAFKPEIVLLDVGLPGMDGYEVASRLRAEVALDPLRLIAVTGYGRDADRKRSEMAGFECHLVKPIDFSALLRLLAGSLSGPH
jgi:PAS domain S-box-containing protein